MRTGILENLGEVITILVSRVPRSSWKVPRGHPETQRFANRKLPLTSQCQTVPLRARNSGLHLVRVRAFCAAPIESRGHVKIGFSRLHTAIAIRGAHNQCRIDLGVRPTRNAATIDVVTRDPAGAAGTPREPHLVLRDPCARQRFNHRSCRSIAAEGDSSRGGSTALRRECHAHLCALSSGKRHRKRNSVQTELWIAATCR